MHPLPGGRAGIGIVWGQHYVVHREQGAIGGQGLVLEHVQRRAANCTRFQSGYQRGFIHDRAAGGVDQDCLRAHLTQCAGIDQPEAGGVQVAVD